MPIRRKTKKKSQVKKDKPRFNPGLPNPLSTDNAKKIIRQIKAHTEKHAKLIKADHSLWYCGITNNPIIRNTSHKYINKDTPYAWKYWNAYSRRIAEAIETYCHKKLGMKDKDAKGGASQDSKWVYVYKKHKTILD